MPHRCLIGYSAFVPTTLRHEIRSIQRLRFPSIHLQFRIATPSEMVDSVGSGVFQAGVTFAPIERNDLQQIPSFRTSACRFPSRPHSANGSSVISLADLRTHPLIVTGSERTHPALSQWLLDQCAIAGFKPNIVEEATSSQEAFDLVQDGVGIAIVPGGICDGMPPALQCSPTPWHGAVAAGVRIPARKLPNAQRIVSDIANSLAASLLSKDRLNFFARHVVPASRFGISKGYKRLHGDSSKASSQPKKVLDNKTHQAPISSA